MADLALSEASAGAAARSEACAATSMVPAPSELAAFRAAAATRGAYTAQVSTGEVLFAAIERAPENFAPEDIAETHATLERLLTNISCRATQRDPNLRPLRVALASLKRRANELLPTRPRTKRPRSATPPRCALLEAHGPRHLCEHLCYFNFYEPARRRAAAQTPPASPGASSRFFGAEPAAPPASPAAGPWRPPRSPFGLLEELLWDRPWALLLSCILLNQTTRRQVDPVLCRLLREWPDAAAAAAADAAAVEAVVRPLGLHRRRSRTIIAFSKAFLEDSWTRADELPGVGVYGAAAEAIFCRGDRSTKPCDHALALYLRWWRALEREEEVPET